MDIYGNQTNIHWWEFLTYLWTSPSNKIQNILVSWLPSLLVLPTEESLCMFLVCFISPDMKRRWRTGVKNRGGNRASLPSCFGAPHQLPRKTISSFKQTTLMDFHMAVPKSGMLWDANSTDSKNGSARTDKLIKCEPTVLFPFLFFASESLHPTQVMRHADLSEKNR